MTPLYLFYLNNYKYFIVFILYISIDKIYIYNYYQNNIYMSEYNFVLFGCWNRGDSARNNDFYKVVELIKRNNHASPTNIFVAGDNYYPLKEEVTQSIGTTTQKSKKKYYNEAELKSGFDKLIELTPTSSKIDILLGNHDLEAIGHELYIPDRTNPLGDGSKCVISQKQNEIINEKPILSLSGGPRKNIWK